MQPPMMTDWTRVAGGLSLGVFPWISQLRQLDLHFKRSNLDLKSIDNFFASLFAIGIAAYGNWAPPDQLLDLPRWYWCLLAALLLTVVFFSIFLYNREGVAAPGSALRWPIILNFVLYNGVFCCLATGFATLAVYQDYVIVEGRVIMQTGGAPIADATIELSTEGQLARYTALTNLQGRFRLVVPKAPFKAIDHALITAASYEDRKITVDGGINIHGTLRQVRLRTTQ